MQERRAVETLTPTRRRTRLLTAAVGILTLAADQGVTSWALADVRQPVHLVGPLGLAVEYNTGVAFSALAGAGEWVVALVVIVLAAVVALALTTQRLGLAAAYGLVLGGALGNLGDRIFRGGRVVDYVTLSHWPTFNVADVGITAGVVVLVVSMLFAPGSPSQRRS